MQTRLRSTVAADTRWLVLDAGAMSQFGSSGADMMLEFAAECGNRGLCLVFAEMHTEAREMLERADVLASVGQDMVFDVLDDAYQAFLNARREAA